MWFSEYSFIDRYTDHFRSVSVVGSGHLASTV